MAVNPKKLRPYDQPPKVRRPILPTEPDSAATWFLVAALVWFLLATGIGMLWAAMQLFPVQLTFSLAVPTFSGTLSVQLSPATVGAGFWNSLVYGWLGNAGLAAVFFITPRLLGTRLADEPIATASAGFWNVGLLVGLVAVYVPQVAGTGFLTEFPLPVDGVLLLALLLASDAFWRTLLAARGEVPYVSVWYFGVALASLLGLYALGTLAPLLGVSTTGAALAGAFYARGLETLCVSGFAIGTLFYLIPRATGNPLHSSGLAMLGWLLWLGLATLAPLARLVDTSIPYAVTQLGNTATLLLVVPVFLIVANLLQTMTGRWALALSPGTIPFALVALTVLVATAMLDAIGGLGSVRTLVGGTEWVMGVRLFALLGTATLAFLALAEHALPRLLRRDWHSNLVTEATLWTAFGGAGLSGLALIAGGIAHGSLVAQAAAVAAIDSTLFWFRLVAAGGLGLAALGALGAVLNAFLMYTGARRSEYAISGDAAIAPAAH